MRTWTVITIIRGIRRLFFVLRSWIWFANIIYLCKGTYAGGKGGNLRPKAGKYQNCKTAIIATISRLHKCTICTIRLDAHLLHWADCGVRSITFWCHFFIPSVCKDSGCLIKRRWSRFTFILAQLACTLQLLCTCFAHFHTLHTFTFCTLSYSAHTSHILAQLACTRFTHMHLVHAKSGKTLWWARFGWRWVLSILVQCTMLPLSTKSCLKSNKLRPILNGQFCHAISKNICLNVFGSKQPREILVFVILKL